MINVIGGSGFVGCSLISMLLLGQKKVLNLDLNPRKNENFKSVLCDIRFKNALTRAISPECDMVINLAPVHPMTAT